MFLSKRFITAACITALLVATVSTAAQAQEDIRTLTIRNKGNATAIHSDKWIGVGCQPIHEALRGHLDLAGGQGLMVNHVAPESPAEKAGIKKHDVLVSVNGEPLKGIGQLVQAVATSGDEGVRLEWIHKGNAQTQTVHPAERPARFRIEMSRPWEHLKDFRWQGDLSGEAPFQMRFFGRPFEMDLDFPADLRIEVKKHGKEPAKITVKKNDEEWNLDEHTLDQLPPEIRRHVDRFAGGDFLLHMPRPGRVLRDFDLDGEVELDVHKVPGAGDLIRPRGALAPNIEMRLDEMNRRIEKLFEELKQIRLKPDDEAQDTDRGEDRGETKPSAEQQSV